MSKILKEGFFFPPFFLLPWIALLFLVRVYNNHTEFSVEMSVHILYPKEQEILKGLMTQVN